MSPRVNLLPAAYQRRSRRSRRLRVWLAAGSGLLAVELLVGAALTEIGTRSRDLNHQLMEIAGQRENLGVKLVELTAQEQEAARQLELAEQLSRKHRWSELLGGLAAAMPGGVVLTRVATEPKDAPAPQAAPGNAAKSNLHKMLQPAGAATAKAPDDGRARGLTLSGMAVDHQSVAEFLRQLNADGRLGSWDVESTVRQPYLGGEGVLFTLKARW